MMNNLEKIASDLRKTVIGMVYKAGSGHPGGSLSAVDIITALYFNVLKIDPENPNYTERDRFILSKGHAAPILYAALAKRGFFPKEDLSTLRKFHSHLQGHPDMNKTAGVDMSTGSLGHGLSVGLGMALSAKLQNRNWSVFVLLGDGEIQEGEVWEAAMAASKYRVDNLIAILDYNRVQLDGQTDEIMPLGDVVAKWKAFGWHTIETDGHNPNKLAEILRNAKHCRRGLPQIVIAHTVKGKGVSFMEGKYQWHGAHIDENTYQKAMKELEGK